MFQQASEFKDIEGIEDALGLKGPQSTWRFAGALMAWLNKISEEGISADDLSASKTPEMKASGEAYKTYQRLLSEYNYLDFSTIQVEMLRLLENPEVCALIQRRFDYLMIDEYQDTNTIQERIVLKLAEGHKNICVVGDDDQALYRFRGASIRNILEFPSRFADRACKQVRLTKNYRSEPPIIDFYNRWMDP
ncbi:ATP-dependent DNA helicase PcrA [Roseovarius albus]|uniref:DNA 3'-5' helicase II n=1 Tax=Roseovarius albus TaxID=1247867 RepID=A0A1X6Z2W1_9RHOB|nr:ATP-dependent DNA helicase PcrA [Roseovarius albus]